MRKGQEHLHWEGRVRELGLLSLEERMHWRDLTVEGPYSGLLVPEGGLQESEEQTFYKGM